MALNQRPHTRIFAAAIFFAACRLVHAQDSQQHQQGIFLKDPTPREPDLEQKYAVNPNTVGMVDHASITLNAERQALIAHASKDLATLAAALKGSLATHAQGSYAPEVQVATLMESLAKNINGALRAGTANMHSPAAARQEEDATKDTTAASAGTPEARRLGLERSSARLVVLTQQLQTDVTGSGTNTLSFTALTHSAEIEILAKNLKQKLKKNPRD